MRSEKADHSKMKRFAETLLLKLSPQDAHAHPHHRTVHIHSETEMKSEAFSQHQTRDLTLSLESGDSISPSVLESQIQKLQSLFNNTSAEKDALLQQV